MTVPADQIPASRSPSSNTRRPRDPATRSLTSSNCPPPARISTTSRETVLDATRAVLCRLRKISSVPRSSVSTMACLTLSWMHDSTVHMNRVPMLMPSAPSASAATRPRASPKPPEAIIGISIFSAAAGISTRPGTSSSPGWPAHSKPSMLMPSTPRLCAFTACRTDVHLCSTLMPLSWNIGRCGAGLEPAVSTILIPASTITCRYSS